MYKKLLAVLLICTLLVSFSPAVAADPASAQPTVEEILSNYHAKASQAEKADNLSTASADSRSSVSSEKTLEQETVEELNAAGYEAYHVTASNYDTLEDTLKTDFASMGLDPNSSYIVVVSGEDSDNSNNTRGIGDNLITPTPEPGEDTDPSFFTHTYDGKTYNMRYLTVTSSDDPSVSKPFEYDINNEILSTYDILHEAMLFYAIEEMNPIPIGSITSLLSDLAIDPNFTPLQNNSFEIIGRTTWTLQYIQVYNFNSESWVSSQLSEYASSWAYCRGRLYDPHTDSETPCAGNTHYFTTYSPIYNDTTLRKDNAAYAFTRNTLATDITEEIDFYLMNYTASVNYYGNGEVFFTQDHWMFPYE